MSNKNTGKRNPYKRKKMSRTLEQISQEYASMAQKAGHIGYQMDVLEAELESAYASMRSLNIEASKLQSKPEPEAVTPTPVAEVPSEQTTPANS